MKTKLLIIAILFSAQVAKAEPLLLFGQDNPYYTYLGCINCVKNSSDSLQNRNGQYGSRRSSTSVFNKNSLWGSRWSGYSVCNSRTNLAPVIFGASSQRILGFLSTNPRHPYQTRGTYRLARIICQ